MFNQTAPRYSMRIIKARIIGKFMLTNNLSKVKVRLDETTDNLWSYTINAYGYNVSLFTYRDGSIHAHLIMFGRICAKADTLVEFCNLIKNCKRWAEGQQ